MATDPVTVDVALQGGGAHGAFTWGVLRRLLDDDTIEIEGVSGTSAGAMNAVALAQGLATGGRAEARRLLDGFWARVGEAAAFSPVRRTALDRLLGGWSLRFSPGFYLSQQVSRLFSPYQANPLDLNPLRDIVASHFDFGAINGAGAPKLFLGATNVRTGRLKVFRQPAISAEAVMASACLPFLFRAVEIEGEAYWDGGYIGNPPLFPLVDETEARDVILVQVNPFTRPDIPKTAYEIENRLNEITFNASLMKDLRALGFLWEIIRHEGLGRAAYRDARLHRIEDEEAMRGLSASSKLAAETRFLNHLREIGERAADRWLAAHRADLGRRGTWYPAFVFEESLKPAHLPEGAERGEPG